MTFLHRLAAALSCAAFACAFAARAAEIPTEPILRIETGRHTAISHQIAVDSQARWLATASHDKTLRIWNLQSATLLQTLRPPIGSGDEGKLYGVALSPDGALVATGGHPIAGDDGTSIYVFERSSGRMIRRMSGLRGVISRLAWSPDGRFLAVALGGGSGLRVYRTSDFTLVGGDADIKRLVDGLDFDRGGRLVASAWDGMVRLYRVDANRVQLVAKQAAPGGKEPGSVRFSPDGKVIAVTFNDAPVVNLLAADTLAFLHAPPVAGLDKDAVLTLAWSADGQTLHAATAVGPTSTNVLLRNWSQAGRGAGTDIATTTRSIVDMIALPDGAVVFGTADPAWGIVDASGRRARFVAPSTVDFRDAAEQFQVSADGRVVRFGAEGPGKAPVRFSVADRGYVAPAAATGLLPPRVTADGTTVRDWRFTLAPTVNGAPLPLSNGERSASAAVIPGGQAVVVGTAWYLRMHDKSGGELWAHQAPDAVWAVNVTADGRMVVAAYGDGTVRWHRLADGEEILALFPDADGKRWVLWTPSGYYEASPGAEDLIGWHVNRGKDNVADFFPASRFRAQFNRPDVIARIVETLDEPEAIRLANTDTGRKVEVQPVKVEQVLPPVVEILAPADGTTVTTGSVAVRYAVRSPGNAPMTGVRVRVNGQFVALPEAANAGASADGVAREIAIPIPPQDSVIQIFAENRNGFSTPAEVRVAWKGRTAAPEPVSLKPKLYVLAVGVSKYKNPDYNLGLAAKDARDFAAVLEPQQGKLYAEVKVRLLTDSNATKDAVLDGLEWLKKEVTSRDVGMLLLAGHGINDNLGNFYFLPHDANLDSLLRTGVAQNDIRIVLGNLAGKAVFFIDTCHSGNALGTARTRGVNTEFGKFAAELADTENGVVVFTASTGRQESLEDSSWGNGAFTKAVVEGLGGKADYQKTGRVTHKGLDYYVAERVKQLTNGKQSPVSIAPAGIADFPIAVVGTN